MSLRTTSRRTPIYQVIEEELRKRIQKGAWSEGERVLSPQEICREFKVSMITANRSLQNLSHDGLIERHPGRGSFVRRAGFRGHSASAKTRTVALVAPRRAAMDVIFEGFYSVVSRTFVHRGHDAGFDVRIAFMPVDGSAMPSTAQEWLGASIQGVVFLALSGFGPQVVALARRYGLPSVMVDTYIEGWPCVVSDHAGAALRVCHELRARGHRRIGYLGNHVFGNNLSNEADRAAVIVPIARDTELDLGDRVDLRFDDNDESRGRVEQWVRQAGVTAVVCSTYKQYRALRNRSPQGAPERFPDLGVVALDAWMEEEPGVPLLTGTCTGRQRMGEMACEWLNALMHEPDAPRDAGGKRTVPMEWQEGRTLPRRETEG